MPRLVAECIVNLSKKPFPDPPFAPGQMYVALSRCRTLEGMKLRTPVRIEEVMVDEVVADYMKSL